MKSQAEDLLDMSDSEAPLRERLRRVFVPLTLLAVIAITGFRCFELVYYHSVNVLFFDQWDYMTLFFGKEPSWTDLFFVQHGPIREGVGLVVDKYLYAWTSWNTRAESFLILACVFSAMLLALLLKKKLFGKLAYGDVAIPMMFLTLKQGETFVGTPNAAYSGFPLLFMMLYCLALLQPRYQVRYPLLLVLCFLLTYTGFGFFMGPVTIVVFALECYWRFRGASDIPMRASLGVLTLVAIMIALFFVHYYWNPAVDCFVFPYGDLKAYPWFGALMIGGYLYLTSPLWLSTAVGLVCMLGGMAIMGALAVRAGRGKRFENIELVVAVLLMYATLFCANTAVGRVCLGLPDAAWGSRYATLVIPGALGVYLYLQSLSSARVRNAMSAALILLLIPGCLFIPLDVRWYSSGKRNWAQCYLLTENIAQCDKAARFPIYPAPEHTHLKEKLDYLKEHHLNLFSD